jgi:hypothetical protein
MESAKYLYPKFFTEDYLINYFKLWLQQFVEYSYSA